MAHCTVIATHDETGSRIGIAACDYLYDKLCPPSPSFGFICQKDLSPVDCSAATCELHSAETHKPLPDPPVVYSCTVPSGCEARYAELCSPHKVAFASLCR
jgi:hypothetical protein